MIYVYAYFAGLVVLVILANIPTALFLASMLGLPGTVLVASNTVLLYSVLLLPFFIWPRALLARPPLALLALAPALIVAFGIPALSQWRRDVFVAGVTRNDFDRVSPGMHPRTLTLVGTRAFSVTCNDTCERLLYNGEADKVVMARWSGVKPEGAMEATVYRVAHNPPCKITPITPGPHSFGARARMDAGDCIAAELNADAETVDATVSQWPLYISMSNWSDPRTSIDQFAFTLDSIEQVTLFPGGAKATRPVLQQTLVSARAFKSPLHFGLGGQAFSPTIVPAVTEGLYTSDATEKVLRQKLGLTVEPVVKPR